MSQSKKRNATAARASIASGEDIDEKCADLKEMLSKVQIQQEAIAKQLEGIASSPIFQNSCEYQQLKSLATCLPLFEYPSETFDEWYFKYGEIFKADTTPLNDQAKVQLLLSRLGETELNKFNKFGNIYVKAFPETTSKLMSLFAKTKSLVTRRLQCVELEKKEHEDLISYGQRIDKAFCTGEMGNTHPDQMKCLMFVSGLKSPKEEQLRKWFNTTPAVWSPDTPLVHMQKMSTYLYEKKYISEEPVTKPKESQSKAWCIVHLDFYRMEDIVDATLAYDFIVLFDAYSQWAEVYSTRDTKAATIVSCLECVFSRIGLPETLVLSCDPCSSQVKSKPFIAFCSEYDKIHIRPNDDYKSSHRDYLWFKEDLRGALEWSMVGGECVEETLELFLLGHRIQSVYNAPDNKTPTELMKGHRLPPKEDSPPPQSAVSVFVK